MRTFQERASLARQESESWSEQAAQVRSDAQGIERELGQPFFAWLSDRVGSDGRPIGAAGAMRIASPQTAGGRRGAARARRRVHRRALPRPGGPGPGDGGRRRGIRGRGGRAARRLCPRDRGRPRRLVGGRARPGLRRGRAHPGRGRGRRARRASRDEDRADHEGNRPRGAPDRDAGRGAGRAAPGVAAETNRPFEEHATENLPVVGDWLAGTLYGSAKNAVPDGAPQRADRNRPAPDQRDWGDSSP